MTIVNPTDAQSASGTQKRIEIPCADQTLEDDANTDSDEANGAVDETVSENGRHSQSKTERPMKMPVASEIKVALA